MSAVSRRGRRRGLRQLRRLGALPLALVLTISAAARAAEDNQAGASGARSDSAGPPADAAEPLPPADRGRGGAGAFGLAGPAPEGVSYLGGYAPDTVLDRVRLSSAVHRSGADEVALAFTAGDLHFQEAVPLAGAGTGLVGDLYDFGVDGRYSRRIANDKEVIGRLRLGSASDKPFTRWDVMTIGAGASLVLPGGDHGRWVLSLDASNNNPILNYIPIPGVAYVYRTSTLTAVMGLPFASVRWRPAGLWTLSALVSPATLDGEAACGDPRRLQGFAGFSAGARQSYLPAERANADERLFLEEKRAVGGVRVSLPFRLTGEAQFGYVFARSMFETTGAALLLGSENVPKTTLGDGLFVGWSLRAAL